MCLKSAHIPIPQECDSAFEECSRATIAREAVQEELTASKQREQEMLARVSAVQRTLEEESKWKEARLAAQIKDLQGLVFAGAEEKERDVEGMRKERDEALRALTEAKSAGLCLSATRRSL